jgi:hypothetical protein
MTLFEAVETTGSDSWNRTRRYSRPSPIDFGDNSPTIGVEHKVHGVPGLEPQVLPNPTRDSNLTSAIDDLAHRPLTLPST